MSIENEPQTSLYYVIPAEVFEDDRLEESEIMFYAFLSGLSRSKGYCYASNEYLAKKRKVTDRCIKYWLDRLEEFGYIKREVTKNGFKWDRKIFITHARISKNSYQGNSSSLPKGTPVHHRGEPQFTIIEEEINNRSSKEKVEKENGKATPPQTPPPQEKASPISKAPEKELRKAYGSHVALSEKEFQELESKKGKESLLRIIEEINDYCLATGKKYKCYSAAIRNWFRREDKYHKNYQKKPLDDRRQRDANGNLCPNPCEGLF